MGREGSNFFPRISAITHQPFDLQRDALTRVSTVSRAHSPKEPVISCQNFPGTFYMHANGMRNGDQMLHGDQTTGRAKNVDL